MQKKSQIQYILSKEEILTAIRQWVMLQDKVLSKLNLKDIKLISFEEGRPAEISNLQATFIIKKEDDE